jgi:hypothetical protein
VPAEATIRRTLTRLDADALAAAGAAWLANQERDREREPSGTSGRRSVAVHGKTLRGAHTATANGDGRPAHLLAAMDHFVLKANQPTLLVRCQRLPWHRVPVLDRTRDRGHGRVEIRNLKAVSVRHFGFPHAAAWPDETDRRSAGAPRDRQALDGVHLPTVSGI